MMGLAPSNRDQGGGTMASEQHTTDEIVAAASECLLRVVVSLSHRAMHEAIAFIARDLAVASRPLSSDPAEQARAVVASAALDRISGVIDLRNRGGILDPLAYLQALQPSGDLDDIVHDVKSRRGTAPSDRAGEPGPQSDPV